MPKLPAIAGDQLIRALEKVDFQIIRQRGSHVRMEHDDGRVVTVPVHAGKSLGKGLLRKILRDAEITVAELIGLIN